MHKQVRIPIIGTKGTKGVLKARGTSGMVLRTIRMAAQTKVNARSVPILVISPATCAGINPANRLTSTINRQLLCTGVRKRWLILEKNGGKRPSRLMLRNTRLCPSRVTMITEQYPNRMARMMALFNHG